MSDYYSILGLSKHASDIEIKSAFRKLAKTYHPDKNPNDPNAKHLFEIILKAYNTLINPQSRKKYDDAFIHHKVTIEKNQSNNSRKKGQKEWSTTEEDIKRREYYKTQYQHIKYNTQATSTANSYSDYKSILFATPIAIGLLMLIISFFNNEPKSISSQTFASNTTTYAETISLNNGSMPYRIFFGDIKTFNTKYTLQINNSSAYDAVIIIFSEKTHSYLQHAYLKSSYSVEFSMLPKDGIYWKCVLGKHWNAEKIFLNNSIHGGFDSIIQYQNWITSPVLFNSELELKLYFLDVLDKTSKNKQYISNELEFFEN